MDMSICRTALILHATHSGQVFALFGKSRTGITTIGGRIGRGENWLDCLVRELNEETRGILNYSLHKEIFLTKRCICFDQCMYVFYQTTYEKLVSVSERFPLTTSVRDVCNEMLSLEVCSIDELIIDILVTQSSQRKFRYNDAFQSMFLTIGYDLLKGNTCNHITTTIDLEAEISVLIASLPRVVCLTAIPDNLPMIYGVIPSKKLYITDQFFSESKNESGEIKRLFRSGWF